MLSYLWARIRPPKDQSNFEGWVAARFGWRLYRIFFKTYTEKVWGVPATEIQADWAAQRIKNLSLFKAVMNALLPKRNQKDITSLIEEFQYPKYGPGMMWEVCTREGRGAGLQGRDGDPHHRHPAHRTARPPRWSSSRKAARPSTPARHVISSMPISALVMAMDPPAPAEVQAAAKGLGYRDFLTVALVVPESAGFPDNWIYVHSPEVRLGRIQNFGSWSPYLVKEGRTCLGLEYFVFEGDDLWASDDADLVELGKRELEKIGLVEGRRRRGRLRRADAQGLSRLRRDLQGQRRHHAGLARQPTCPTSIPSAATACTATTTRTTRCTRPCSRWRTSSAPATTSGTSTSKRSTTRRSPSTCVTAEHGTGRAAPITPRRQPAEVVIPDEAEVDAG